ncbi:MAG: hypothetical protein MRY83_06840 [Flavobacteriales bacterium]|nr:hypothetical protein [Flavobacteriales bacterium]
MGLGNLFRSKYDNRTFEFKEEYWLDAMKVLDAHERQKKKRLFIYWSMAAVFALFLAGAGFWLMKSNSGAESNNLVENQVIDDKDIDTFENGNTDFRQNEEISSAYEEKESLSSVKENETKDSKRINTTKEERKITNPIRKFVGSEDPSLKDENVNNVLLSDVKDETISGDGELTSDLEQMSKSSDEPVEEVIELEPSEQSGFDDISLLESLPVEFSTNDELELVKKDKDYYKSPVGYWGMNIYTGYQNNSSIVNLSENLDDDVIAKRQLEENTINSQSYGVEGFYQFKSFNFSAGLLYSCFGEQLDYSKLTQEEMIEMDVTQLVVTSKTEEEYVDNGYYMGNEVLLDGEWTWVPNAYYVQDIDTIYKVTYDSSYVSHTQQVMVEREDERIADVNGYNTYKAIDIPMLVGYSLNMGNVGVGLRTGVSVGYVISQKAKYLDNESILHVEKSQVQQWTPSFIVRPSIWYSVSDKLAVYAEPQWRKQLKPVVKVDGMFDNTYESYGVNLGLRISF